MGVSSRAWSTINEADYGDGRGFCRACLIDLNEPGQSKAKSRCKLPVYEPNGDLNRNAVHAAAAALVGARGGVDAPAADKRAAARKLLSLYARLEEEPPDSLRRMLR